MQDQVVYTCTMVRLGLYRGKSSCFLTNYVMRSWACGWMSWSNEAKQSPYSASHVACLGLVGIVFSGLTKGLRIYCHQKAKKSKCNPLPPFLSQKKVHMNFWNSKLFSWMMLNATISGIVIFDSSVTWETCCFFLA